MARLLPLLLSALISATVPLSDLKIPGYYNSSIVRTVAQQPVDDDGDETQMVCTAFVVNGVEGLAITAEHCLPHPEGGFMLANGVSVEIVKVEGAIGLIKLPYMVAPLPLAKDEAEMGDTVVGLGYAYGGHKYIALTGRVSVTDLTIQQWKDVNIVDYAFVNGMSGGPLLNTRGEVVGVIQASNDRVGLTSSLRQIKHILKEK